LSAKKVILKLEVE